ncbi:BREX-6 system BrxE protein [Geomonas paludis]|uniref:BREX-6 system BrxE protein n=1 Tax=Geomonas paludis TaxID=2740185 RepID=A0ABY4LHM8_9BACT|nr:BREX-6 system BrxE protein [Geomonas paludis]UPU37479.1 BREX-6 system BrxE protein [Geomonas paludis]
MSIFEIDSPPTRAERTPIPVSDIDLALTAQLVVAWAGEAGEEKRLGWWRSDLISEFGGEDLFRRLLPSTWAWAVLQGARETARRKDAELRGQDHDPDRILSLFSFGFDLDERIEERFQDLKRSGQIPQDVLPGLALINSGWNYDGFFEWVDGHGDVEVSVTLVGRRIKGAMPSGLDQLVRRLVAGLAPASDNYPLPHFHRAS